MKIALILLTIGISLLCCENETKQTFSIEKYRFPTSKITKEDCPEIERSVDEFTGIISLNSATSNRSMILYKCIGECFPPYHLRLRAHGSTSVSNASGIIILFSDGSKWTSSEKIDVTADSKGFEYTAFITLTASDLITLSTKTISKYRLYFFDEQVNANDAEKFKIYADCMKEAK